MALNDPAEKNLIRMEGRRFAQRCDTQMMSIERADTLREVARLAASVTLPYVLSSDYTARDALRLVQTRAEERARQLIQEQLQNFSRTDENQREKQKRAMLDTWANLTGPLGHLRTWAQSKLNTAEHQNT